MVSETISDSVVIFALDELRFALSMNAVERVVRAVEISPWPDAPPGVVGMVNVHGRIMPVLDVRPRFGLTPRELRLSDHLVIARTGHGEVAVLVDAAVDVIPACNTTATLSADALPGFGAVEGVMVHGDGIVPIQDLTRFLPAESRKTPELKLAA